jgi:hypothetical protein
LRLPLWLTYAVIFAIPTALIVATGGGPLPLERYRYYLLAGFWTVFPLGLMHHLDRFASRALDQFRPACDLNEKEAEDLRWRLSTMPAVPAALAGLAGVLFVGALFRGPQMFQIVKQPGAVHRRYGLRPQLRPAQHDVSPCIAAVGQRRVQRARRLDLFNRVRCTPSLP